jgi:tRNA dimethylallyltransferase
LTAAPGPAARERLEHRLVGSRPVSATFSVGEFMPLAHREIDAAVSTGRRPIVVGGTGLYLRAALADLDLRPPPAPGTRERLERRLATEGPEMLHAALARRAPAVARAIDPSDRSRVVRAHELLDAGEDPLAISPEGPSQLWAAATRRPTLLCGLVMERERLYARIDERIDRMIAHGAMDEVRRALDAGASPTARQALGFEELLRRDLDGLRRRTRNYAKRQLTWMRKLSGVQTIDVTDRGAREVALEVAARL